MKFSFEGKSSDSAFVDVIWRTQSEQGGSFMSQAEAHWGMVFTTQNGKTTVTVRGPETYAQPAPVPHEADFFGINFKLGTFLRPLPAQKLVDDAIDLPAACHNAFCLYGSAWQLPTYENVDTFLHKLAREGLLDCDPLVNEVLQNRPSDLSVRSVQRRFLHATGLTPVAIRQIDRAKQAAMLLEQGVSILDTVYEAGYFDQAHLTRSLKRFLGQTPAQFIPAKTP